MFEDKAFTVSAGMFLIAVVLNDNHTSGGILLISAIGAPPAIASISATLLESKVVIPFIDLTLEYKVDNEGQTEFWIFFNVG
jgi:hypothetical protein